MAHVTFIHGIANKPAADALHEAWLRYLATNLPGSSGVDLRSQGVTSTMVYWADVLYPEPLSTVEGLTESAPGVGAALTDESEILAAEQATAPMPRSIREAAFLSGLAMKYGAVAVAEDVASGSGMTERIPVPFFLKKKLMEAWLRDVHHYLFNVAFSPRPGTTYRVQDEIRRRMIEALQQGSERSGPHLVVSHSMGTVIAYDCLKRVESCPRVDFLMTVGSPLGLDEVQDELQPGWSRQDGYPSQKLAGSWVNVFDRLDPVAGFDAYLANDYLEQGSPRVTDIHEPNFGRWRHDIAKYFRGAQLRNALRQTLSMSGPAESAMIRPAPVAIPAATPAALQAAPNCCDPTNSVTWTIPLQITVSLGALTAAVGGTAVAAPESQALAAARSELERNQSRPYFDSAANTQVRTAYYRSVSPGNDARAFYLDLSGLLKSTHTTRPRYSPSTQLYPWIDLQPDRKLKSVYSGQRFEPLELIRQDLETERIVQERLTSIAQESVNDPVALEAIRIELEAAMPFNCEHVVPQSWFNKREPMRGDLHHLFACESGCNSFRGNTPYFDFPDFNEAVRSQCGKREQNKFEPSAGKGAVARATLYFLLRYPGEINRTANELTADRLTILLGWHRDFPAGDYERHRNQAIFETQGNRNPLIDFPEWAERIDFSLGLG
jgi:endonuclease I